MMKFQFSLRTLVVVVILVSIALGFGVKWWAGRHAEHELNSRYNCICRVIDGQTARIRGAARAQAIGLGWKGWYLHDVLPEKTNSDYSFTVTSTIFLMEDSSTHSGAALQLTGLRISSARSKLSETSLDIEYDDSPENKPIVDQFELEFKSRGWAYALRHIDKVDNPK